MLVSGYRHTPSTTDLHLKMRVPVALVVYLPCKAVPQVVSLHLPHPNPYITHVRARAAPRATQGARVS
jgi:hypothetical protein